MEYVKLINDVINNNKTVALQAEKNNIIIQDNTAKSKPKAAPTISKPEEKKEETRPGTQEDKKNISRTDTSVSGISKSKLDISQTESEFQVKSLHLCLY